MQHQLLNKSGGIINCLIVIALTGFVNISCNQDSDKKLPKKISLTNDSSDIAVMPSDKDTCAITFRDFLLSNLVDYNLLKDSGLTRYYSLDKAAYTEKLSFKFKKKSSVSYGDIKGVYPECEIYLYSFSDSLKCKTAFSAWIRTIGEDDLNLIGTDRKYVKSPPVYSILANRNIFILYYLCEHSENDWSEVKKIITDYPEIPKTVMEIGCGGPLKWSEPYEVNE